ncbi:Omega-hydroxypalmitate O-feruloyl transferase [Quillaja saponaria]|uniref:Omega-hydroxypalmitate O-feruloyl transferase n=1 Tax=Quillaja saponaria TaxID=32244 RepID=A0AAD7LXP6_QUISA|nr:Omega-hydroxypalmitate O-feruloyl transferase [Quillaja saponaria]
MATQHESHQTVSITKIVTVYPKVLQPQRVLNLSNLDRQCHMLMYLVFFYNNPSDHQAYENLSPNSVFNSLKYGLEVTLSVWYPAAGRLSLNRSDGTELNLLCNNDGAILVEAMTRVKISELGDFSEYNEFFENLVYKPVIDGNFSKMPLLVAQVTRFGCGGYSIGIGASHSLFDGPAAYSFFTAWAYNSTIVKRECVIELHKPVHERGTLLLGNSQASKGITTLPTTSNPQIRPAAIDHLYQLIMQETSEKKKSYEHQLPQIGGSDQKNKYVLKTYHLSTAMMQDLKKKHFFYGRDYLHYSSFEVLSAHLWKARTKALGLSKEKMVCLQFSVDTRKKMVPPLPESFSGNAYVLASVILTVGELEEASHEAIIEKIRAAKKTVNNDYVKVYIEALKEGQQASLPPLKELTLVSDWTRMPFHKIEFFHGQAAYASPLFPPVPQVVYFMQNPIDNGGVDIRIGLDAQTINAFTYYFLTNVQ